MRVVVDTNVAVSALISPSGTPAAIIAAWRQEKYEWVVTPETLAELERVLERRKVARYLPVASTRTERFLKRVSEKALMVQSSEPLAVVSADPADDRFLEAALEGRADFIVTGDRHLLELREYEGTRIVTPIEFLAELQLPP